MSFQQQLLGKLLNDDLFIRWLEGKASPGNRAVWERWLLQDPVHEKLVEKARKLRTMPFRKIQIRNDRNEEHYRLKKKMGKE